MLILSLGHVPLSWDFMNLFPGSLVVVVRGFAGETRHVGGCGLAIKVSKHVLCLFFVEGLTHALTQVAFFQAFLEPQKKREWQQHVCMQSSERYADSEGFETKTTSLNHPTKFMVGILDKIYKIYKLPNFCIFPYLPLILGDPNFGSPTHLHETRTKAKRSLAPANPQRNCLHPCRCTWAFLLGSLDVDIIAMQQGVQPIS